MCKSGKDNPLPPRVCIHGVPIVVAMETPITQWSVIIHARFAVVRTQAVYWSDVRTEAIAEMTSSMLNSS